MEPCTPQHIAERITACALQRIHIIGGPGSGKSVLARRLGAQLGLPVYELDPIAFEGPHFVDRPLAARLADVQRIAAQPTWITEGMFLGWTDELLRAADLLIWLDHVSWLLAYGRIVRRFARGGIEEAARQSGTRKFTRFNDYARHLKQLGEVFFASRRYYYMRRAGVDLHDSRSATRAATARALVAYGEKTVHCRSAQDLQLLLAHIDQEKIESPLY